MAEIFEKIVGDDGIETYRVVDNLEPLIKESEPYKRVLQESIERRKTIQELKRSVSAVDAADEKPEVKDTPVVDKPELNMEDLEKIVAKRVLEVIKNQQEAEARREADLDALLSQHGLNKDDRAFIAASPDPKAAAEYLGRRIKQFPTPNERSIAPQTDTEVKDFQGRIHAKMFGQN